MSVGDSPCSVNGWVQFYPDFFRVHGARLGPHAWRVLMYFLGLKRHEDDPSKKSTSWCAVRTIAEECHMSRRQAILSIRQLEADGFAETTRRRGTSNIVRLTELATQQPGRFRPLKKSALAPLGPWEVALLCALLCHHKDKDDEKHDWTKGLAKVSLDTAAYLAGMSPRKADQAFAVLVGLGLVVRVGKAAVGLTDAALTWGAMDQATAGNAVVTDSALQPQERTTCTPPMQDVRVCESAYGAPKLEPSSSSSSALAEEGQQEKGKDRERPRPVPQARDRQPKKTHQQPRYSPAFEEAWEKHPRGGKRFAWDAWVKAGLESSQELRYRLLWYLRGMRFAKGWREQDGRFIPNFERIVGAGDWRRVDTKFWLATLLCERLKPGYYGPENLETARDGISYAVSRGMAVAELERLILERAKKFASSTELLFPAIKEKWAREAMA